MDNASAARKPPVASVKREKYIMDYWQHLTWASSALGQDIALYGSHTPEQLRDKAPIIFIGGVHGDEPEGVELAQKWLNWLTSQTNYQGQPWLLITCLNPDGYQKLERTNGNGVDLNRNYPSACWSSEHDAPRYFPGKAPASEPEIAALVKLITYTKPSLIIHFHSWQPSVVYSGDNARWAAELLAKSSGYSAQPDIGYPTPGSLGEYGANDLGVGVVCIEEHEGEPLANVFPRFKQGLIDIVQTKI